MIEIEKAFADELAALHAEAEKEDEAAGRRLEGEPASDDQLLRRARSRALYLLEASDKTEKQLREKLATNYPPEIVDQVIDFVKARHYLDDARFARNYVEMRDRTKSRRVICMELKEKGVSREIVDALDDCFSQDTQQALADRLAGQWLRKKRLDPETAPRGELQKLYRYLLGKGFSYEEAQTAVAHLREAAHRSDALM